NGYLLSRCRRRSTKTAAGRPAPGKIGARRLVSPCGRAPPAQHMHLRALISLASLRRSAFWIEALSALRFPVASIANIAFLSGSARVRLPAGSARAALVVAPLSVAEPDSPKSVRSLLSLLASFAIGVIDCAELHFVRFHRRRIGL